MVTSRNCWHHVPGHYFDDIVLLSLVSWERGHLGRFRSRRDACTPRKNHARTSVQILSNHLAHSQYSFGKALVSALRLWQAYGIAGSRANPAQHETAMTIAYFIAVGWGRIWSRSHDLLPRPQPMLSRLERIQGRSRAQAALHAGTGSMANVPGERISCGSTWCTGCR
jgi:hypothetical protein